MVTFPNLTYVIIVGLRYYYLSWNEVYKRLMKSYKPKFHGYESCNYGIVNNSLHH